MEKKEEVDRRRDGKTILQNITEIYYDLDIYSLSSLQSGQGWNLPAQ